MPKINGNMTKSIISTKSDIKTHTKPMRQKQPMKFSRTIITSLTGLILYVIPQAEQMKAQAQSDPQSGTQNETQPQQPPLSDEERVQKMVFMNANGIISISYAEPWFWEVADYSISLNKSLNKEVISAYGQCIDLKTELESKAKPKLGEETQILLGTLRIGHSYTYEKVLSTLLKKYASGNDVDPETADDKGEYNPISATECAKIDPDNPSLMQHLFPTPTSPHMIGGAIWNVGMCKKIDLLITCFTEVSLLDLVNTTNPHPNQATVNFKNPSVFLEEIEGE